MKSIFLGLFLICSTFLYSQSKTTAKKTATTTSYKKKLSENRGNYYLSNVVKIENGKSEKVAVTFEATVDKDVWDQAIEKRKAMEADYFNLIAEMLSTQAKFELENKLSFEPFKKQTFTFKDGSFVCNYKMMGRNGFGNMVESSADVSIPFDWIK